MIDDYDTGQKDFPSVSVGHNKSTSLLPLSQIFVRRFRRHFSRRDEIMNCITMRHWCLQSSHPEDMLQCNAKGCWGAWMHHFCCWCHNALSLFASIYIWCCCWSHHMISTKGWVAPPKLRLEKGSMKMFLKVITMTAWIMGVIFFKMIIMSNIVKINPVKLKKLHDIVFFYVKKTRKKQKYVPGHHW